MARQHFIQEDGKRVSAASALATVGAKKPLTPSPASARVSRVIAEKQAVPVQRLRSAAVRAAPLLERKSCALSCSSSETNRLMTGGMPRVVPGPANGVEKFDPGLSRKGEYGTVRRRNSLGGG